MSDPDRPAPEDVEAIFGLSDPDDEEAVPCVALVPVTPTFTRTCNRDADRHYVIEPQPGLEVVVALCEQHGRLLKDDSE